MTSEVTAVAVPAAATQVIEPRGFAPAFARVKSELLAIPEVEFSPINIDIPSAAATALGALPEIERELEDIAELPRIDQQRIRKLGDCARALMYAHGVYKAAAGPTDNVSEIADKIIETRDQLPSSSSTKSTAFSRRTPPILPRSGRWSL
jgi:hypothetical protein